MSYRPVRNSSSFSSEPVERKPRETIEKNVCNIPLSVLKAKAIAISQGLLISCNQMSAEYLFMTDKLYDVRYDTGDKVIQCGRHNDIFKLWLQWRAKVENTLQKDAFIFFRYTSTL